MKRASLFFVVVILASFFLLTLAATAKAEPIYATKEPVEIYHPFYVGVFGAWVIPDELILKDENSTKYKYILDNSWGAGAKFGYIFPFKWMAAELEYMYLDDQDVDYPGALYYKANNVMANLIFRYPHGMIRPYIGAGIGWSWAELGHDAFSDSIDMDALAWQGLAGINLEIIPNLSLDIGYRYFMSKYDIDKLIVTGGQAAPVTTRLTEATMADHMIFAGLNFHFGGSKPVPPPPPPEPEPLPIVKEKKCPDTPACCIVDEEGCPIDSDNDGVCDGCDQCPDTRDCCIVDQYGCPIDSDKDGVCDGCDQCPDTPAGVKVDKDGCPLPEIVEKGRTTLEVLFEFDKSAIRENYSTDIDALADVMKKYQNLNVTIEGHTDNINRSRDPHYNKKLSQRRADAVKKYLVEESGIDAKRLTAIGFGAEKPIATNETAEGRQQNRRVEAAVDYIIKK